jgi:hypothetical protein
MAEFHMQGQGQDQGQDQGQIQTQGQEQEQEQECTVRPEITSLIARIERNIARRAQSLENHIFERRIVVDRVVTAELADVPGMDKWLHRNRVIKEVYASQIVTDEFSHGSVRRIDVHNKYTPTKKIPTEL